MTGDPGKRGERLPFGIMGAGLATIERRIPNEEPPPLPPNPDLRVIGRNVPRQNGREKVTGAMHYTGDIALQGMLHARILRSTVPSARVLHVDLEAALCHPEVRAAITLAHPGNRVTEHVRYVGAPIAALAAVSPEAAAEALALIRIEMQKLPFVTDMDGAQMASAPHVFAPDVAPNGHPSGFPAAADLPLRGNVRGPTVERRGDVGYGFSTADVIVEGKYRTHVQTHCCMETHGIVADWRDDGLTVYISTQFTAGVRRELADAFGLRLAQVRVIVDGMGGGFGSKSTLGRYGWIAVTLSREAHAPVRLILSRAEEQVDSGNRPETSQRLKIGARRDGTLTAIALSSCGSAGVGLGAGVGDMASSLYTCPNFESTHTDVFVNAGPGCAMRAPGNVPGAFGLEQSIDELAEQLGFDPLALRDRIDPSPVRREERRIGALRFDWHRKRRRTGAPGPIKRGVGVAQSHWGAYVQLDSACEVRVMRDGSVEVLSGVQDIGTGITTVLAQTVAEVFGLEARDIVVRIGDTDFPAGPPSYGSRTTASITPPARTAAWHVLQALFRAAGPLLGTTPAKLVARDGFIMAGHDPDKRLRFSDICADLRTDRISAIASRQDDYGGFGRQYGDAATAQQDLGGVQFAEVTVDTETGVIFVERVLAVHDCGRPMNPLQIESQVHGGVLMGLSFALFEHRVLDPRTGQVLNPNLEAYKFAGARDAPAIEVIVLQNYQASSATDAYGIAEPSIIPTAPAIANAVYNATGIRLRTTPMTPAVVLSGLGHRPKAEASS